MAADQEFCDAIKAGEEARVLELIEKDSSLASARDSAGVSAILIATYYGRSDILKLLLECKPELDLFEACAVGRCDLVKEYLEDSPLAVNEFAADGFTPLGLAVFFERDEIVNCLLSLSADVNLASRNGFRVAPLHSAVARNRADVAARLLALGADVNMAQQSGFTPLHQAAHSGNREMVELLVSYGANRELKSDDGKRPIEIANECGHHDLASMLG
jgi:ankyrin repeat protein